jgi:hypothetical protein
LLCADLLRLGACGGLHPLEAHVYSALAHLAHLAHLSQRLLHLGRDACHTLALEPLEPPVSDTLDGV